MGFKNIEIVKITFFVNDIIIKFTTYRKKLKSLCLLFFNLMSIWRIIVCNIS